MSGVQARSNLSHPKYLSDFRPLLMIFRVSALEDDRNGRERNCVESTYSSLTQAKR